MKHRTAVSGKSLSRSLRSRPSEKPPANSARKTGLRSWSTNLLTKSDGGAEGSRHASWTSTASSTALSIAWLSKSTESCSERPVSALWIVRLTSRNSMKADPDTLHSLSDVYGVNMMNWLWPAFAAILPVQDDLCFWKSWWFVWGPLWFRWMKIGWDASLRLLESWPTLTCSTNDTPCTLMLVSVAACSNLSSSAARSSLTVQGKPESACFSSRGYEPPIV
mmetsp:Transcript_123439/g.360475  ORF Transcript_123439/g.360475 Transcript_123439/m.360475 type:complete len:221 (+) Transcript_123439:302-964(+)